MIADALVDRVLIERDRVTGLSLQTSEGPVEVLATAWCWPPAPTDTPRS